MSEPYNSGDMSRPLTDGPADQTSWHLWWLWVAATLAGYLAWLIIQPILPALAQSVGLTRVPGGLVLERIVIAALFPGLLATFQYFVLRRYLPGVSPLLWIGLTILAAVTVYLLGEATRPLFPGALDEQSVQFDANGNPVTATLQYSYAITAVFALLRGAFMGLAQWVALKMHLRNAAMWPVANTGTALLVFFLSFGIFAVTGPLLTVLMVSPEDSLMQANLMLVNLGGLALSGLVEGAVMGYVLVVLYRGTVNRSVVQP